MILRTCIWPRSGWSGQRGILAYLDEEIAGAGDPRSFGKALKADLAGLWRYRVGNCRILCQIRRDGELLVLVVAVGHRLDIDDGQMAASPHIS